MHTLALITPWPPQSTGIADYAFDLARGLAEQGVAVSVYTNAKLPRRGGHGIRVSGLSEFPGPHGFDKVVFQMGNSAEHHAEMIPLLARHRGIVHLHDVVLHHLFAYVTLCQGNRRLYLRVLKHWYGEEVCDEVKNWRPPDEETAHFWETGRVIDVPYFEPIMQYASECILHSRFARQMVVNRFPHLSCHLIPQAYRDMRVVHTTCNSHFRLGVFGIIHRNKQVDKAIRAVAYALGKGADISLDVVGTLHDNCAHLPELADQLGIDQHVTFHGRVGDTQFLEIMRSVDLLVTQRYPSMGECSAIVSRALQMGIPTIVNNTGWYAELPDFVEKLPTDADRLQSSLNRAVFRHAKNREWHERVRAAATKYAQEQVDYYGVIARYRSILGDVARRAAA